MWIALGILIGLAIGVISATVFLYAFGITLKDLWEGMK